MEITVPLYVCGKWRREKYMEMRRQKEIKLAIREPILGIQFNNTQREEAKVKTGFIRLTKF